MLFAASRFEALYPASADRQLVRLLFGLRDYRSVGTGRVHLLSPLDLYRAQMLAQIRPYSLAKDDPVCPHGRERLRQIDPGHWTTHVVDADSHGCGVVEFGVLTLSIITAELALSPTELSPDGQPSFFFDHTARGHEGLVLGGGQGGKKKCFQFVEALVCGVRGKAESSTGFYFDHKRSGSTAGVLQPVNLMILLTSTDYFF